MDIILNLLREKTYSVGELLTACKDHGITTELFCHALTTLKEVGLVQSLTLGSDMYGYPSGTLVYRLR